MSDKEIMELVRLVTVHVKTQFPQLDHDTVESEAGLAVTQAMKYPDGEATLLTLAKRFAERAAAKLCRREVAQHQPDSWWHEVPERPSPPAGNLNALSRNPAALAEAGASRRQIQAATGCGERLARTLVKKREAAKRGTRQETN